MKFELKMMSPDRGGVCFCIKEAYLHKDWRLLDLIILDRIIGTE